MQALLAFSRCVDWCTERIGRSVYWLLLAAVLISTANAIVRYAFDISSNAYLEAQWYLFSVVFMLGAGYVFLHDQHVRIDAISSHLSRRTQVWIDVVGIVIFLLPLCGFLVWTSLPSVMLAFETQEVSANPGGLIRWPMYALVPVGFTLLALQALSELFKRLAFLAGKGPDPHAKPEKTDEEMLLEQLRLETEAKEARRVAAAAAAAASASAQGGKP
ncbi:MAG: hypothetical protein AD742_14470 [Methylibium sp. NZG]|nr:MAG: hypothetical protein AD742_14470 [Methylibium sp. NZG]